MPLRVIGESHLMIHSLFEADRALRVRYYAKLVGSEQPLNPDCQVYPAGRCTRCASVRAECACGGEAVARRAPPRFRTYRHSPEPRPVEPTYEYANDRVWWPTLMHQLRQLNARTC